MRFTFVPLIVLTVIAAACDGSDGAPGPQGLQGDPGDPGAGLDRGQMYCLTNAGVNLASGWSVSVVCGAADIPVAGSCYASDQPASAFLKSSRPTNWPDTTVAAGWTCTWGWEAGTEPTDPSFVFAGTAEICCATPQ
jgi:hypothetical protein